MCKCCGHPLPSDAVEQGLSPLEIRIYRAVKRAGQAGITVPDLTEIVYNDDPNGGPESTNTIAVMKIRLNKKLASRKLVIHSTLGRGALYILKALK